MAALETGCMQAAVTPEATADNVAAVGSFVGAIGSQDISASIGLNLPDYSAQKHIKTENHVQ